MDGKIGQNGRGETSCRSGSLNASEAIGFYGQGRKSVPRARRLRSSLTRRRAKRIGMLVVFAAAIVAMFATAVLPSGKGETATPSLADSAQSGRVPGFPYPCIGYTYDSDGTTKLPECTVTVKNMRTGESYSVLSSLAASYYSVDLNEPEYFPAGWLTDDVIDVTAVKGTQMGNSQGIYDDTLYYVSLDVTLNQVIPEFSMLIIPVVGMMTVVAVVSLRRRAAKQ
jgi:hypothetical protein